MKSILRPYLGEKWVDDLILDVGANNPEFKDMWEGADENNLKVLGRGQMNLSIGGKHFTVTIVHSVYNPDPRFVVIEYVVSN